MSDPSGADENRLRQGDGESPKLTEAEDAHYVSAYVFHAPDCNLTRRPAGGFGRSTAVGAAPRFLAKENKIAVCGFFTPSRQSPPRSRLPAQPLSRSAARHPPQRRWPRLR